MRHLSIPANLNIQQLISRHPVDGIAGFHREKVYYICHCIIQGMSYLNADTFTHAHKWEPYVVPRHSKLLKKVIGSQYSQIVNWMMKAGIIKCDGSWSKTIVSQGYRLTDHYLGAGTRWVSIKSNILLKKVRCGAGTEKKYYFVPQIATRLEKWFDAKKLTVEVTGATEEINRTERAAITEAGEDTEKIIRATVNANIARNIVTSLHRGNYHTNQDAFGYRFHSPLTRLSRDLRKYVTYEGKTLVEVDMTGSQLFLSTYLLNYRHWKIHGICNNSYYLNKVWDGIGIHNSKDIRSTIMCLKDAETLFGQGLQDHPFFRFSVSGFKSTHDGIVYEDLLEELDSYEFFPANYTLTQKRDKVKRILLQQLFGDPNNPEHEPLYMGNNRLIWDCFKSLYPEIVSLFDRIRERGCKDLCKLLQRLESVAIQGYVCKWLQEHHPGLPIFTLHDCLITIAGQEHIILEAMRTGIRQFMGYAPKMKSKSWNEDLYPLNGIVTFYNKDAA
jgi:hypothetical protein